MKHLFATFIMMLVAFAATAQIKPKPGKPGLPPTTATDIPITDDGAGNPSDTILPPGAARHAARILTFEFDYPFKLYWKEGEKAGQFQMTPIITKGPDKNTDAMNRVEIQKLTVSVNSTTDPATTHAQLKDGLIDFFSTRGFILQPGSDFGDAIYWGASFAEIVLQVQNRPRLVTDIVSIRGRDDSNNHVIFNWEQLRHFPFEKAIDLDSTNGESIDIDGKSQGSGAGKQ